ncbi:DNA repair and recombination protein RadB [Candidatus Woesearchaeota archaeon]|nr:DNA repair and recombination protein RadB [Candidatus Woesearchaeota archaeon]
METRIGAGCDAMDWLLEGGYEKDVLTTIYGPPGAGKTNFLLLTMANSPDLAGKKIVYIDTEGNFSLSRFKQLTSDHKEILKRTIFLKPTTFEEQRKAFEKLRKIVTARVGVIILDSAAMLYRLELGKTKDIYNVNRELGLQLSYLTEIARKKNIPVLVTNQVYADIDSGVDGRTKMVGGDILRYASKCLIEIKRFAGGKRAAVLQKHRSLPEKSVEFVITDDGVEQVEK